MKYVILALLILGVIILVNSIIKEYNESKRKIKELKQNVDKGLGELNEKIGYPEENAMSAPAEQGSKDIKYTKNSLLEKEQALEKNLIELGICLNKSTDSYCDNIDSLIDELTDLSERYKILKLEKDKYEIILSTVIPILTDEQFAQAESTIAEKIKDLENMEQKMSDSQQYNPEVNNNQNFTQGFDMGL